MWVWYWRGGEVLIACYGCERPMFHRMADCLTPIRSGVHLVRGLRGGEAIEPTVVAADPACSDLNPQWAGRDSGGRATEESYPSPSSSRPRSRQRPVARTVKAS